MKRRQLIGRKVNYKTEIDKLIFIENSVPQQVIDKLRRDKNLDPDRLIRIMQKMALEERLQQQKTLNKSLNTPETK